MKRSTATVPEPAGSYFSNNDFAPVGGSKVVLGFGSFSDQGVDFRPLGGPYIENFQTVNRLPTVKAPDDGQYGFNLKYYAPNFNNGTEFGLFFLNYHSRLPLISGQTGTQAVGLGPQKQYLDRAQQEFAVETRLAPLDGPLVDDVPLSETAPNSTTLRWTRLARCSSIAR